MEYVELASRVIGRVVEELNQTFKETAEITEVSVQLVNLKTSKVGRVTARLTGYEQGGTA